MLKFKEYRNKFTEAALDSGTAQPEDMLKNEKAASIQKQVNQIVDTWVADLKRTLVNPMTPLADRRGLWDRFKNTMSNMWHGRYNQTNPYFWKNKLGDDLGATQESFNPNNLSLSDYKSLRDICESLEEQLNEDVPAGAENLRLIRMIDTKAIELKQKLMSIVSGNDDDFTMSNAHSMSSPDEPKPAASAAFAPQEEEDSKVPSGFDNLVKIIEGFAKSKRMDVKTAQDFIDRLKSPKNSIRQKAADDFERFNAQLKGDKKPPISGPSASPDDASEHGIFFTPPTTGKKWPELTKDEKDRWNRYGGGQAHQKPSKIDGCLDKDHGIKNMPWILRIGDPRREILDAQENKMLPISKNCAGAKSGSHWHREMHKLDRWEHHESPIKSVSELLARVEKAKTATAAARRNMPRSTVSDVDAARNAAMDGETEITNASPTPEPMNNPIPTHEPSKPSLRDRIGSIGDEVPEVKDKFTGTGLSEPMHTGDPEDDSPDPKNRVAGIDGADAIPNPTPKEKKEPIIKSLRQIKNSMTPRIEALSDDETREQLHRTLDTIKDKEGLTKFERELESHEAANMDFEFEWTITDTNNFYKKRLHERKGIPQPLIDNKKIESLTFSERKQYFREQLQKR